MALIKRKQSKNYYDIEYRVNYYNARNTAWDFLIKNNVTTFPLDLHQIIKNNHWELWSYKKFERVCGISRQDLIDLSPDGFTDVDSDNNYRIVVNEENSRHRSRFTTAHEMGHIVLHKVYRDSDKLEKEANIFASRILMPMVLIKELEIRSPQELSDLCDVSIQSAEIRLKRFDDIKGREKFYTNPLEIKLYNNLKPFIEKLKKERK